MRHMCVNEQRFQKQVLPNVEHLCELVNGNNDLETKSSIYGFLKFSTLFLYDLLEFSISVPFYSKQASSQYFLPYLKQLGFKAEYLLVVQSCSGAVWVPILALLATCL